MSSLRIFLLNAENLFLLSDLALTTEHIGLTEPQWQKLSSSVYLNKSLWKLKGLVRSIEEENPDILLLSEIGGEESLKNFNELFLNNRYSIALVEGNSDRNIDIGFLIRKDLGFYFDLSSNKNHILDLVYTQPRAQALKGPYRFSRDAVELSCFLSDPNKPFLIFLHTHLKSHLDPNGIDPDGFQRRSSECRALMELYLKIQEKYQGRVPILVTGDFNGNASRHRTDPEFKLIYENTTLEDVCEAAGLPPEKRISFIQLPRHASQAAGLLLCFT